ncbi:MAG: hypothetical protein V7780_05605 [Colwellia sp.]|jgi:hypothetical protein
MTLGIADWACCFLNLLLVITESCSNLAMALAISRTVFNKFSGEHVIVFFGNNYIIHFAQA